MKENTIIKQILGYCYKSPRAIKRKDFSDKPHYHFEPNYGGYMHMSALFLSVFEELKQNGEVLAFTWLFLRLSVFLIDIDACLFSLKNLRILSRN